MKLRLHRKAEAEIRDAAIRYRAAVEGLERKFLASLSKAFDDLESDPHRYAKLETTPIESRIRRMILDDFPYVVVFEVFEEEVFVYAVAHASRRPNYWQRRKPST